MVGKFILSFVISTKRHHTDAHRLPRTSAFRPRSDPDSGSAASRGNPKSMRIFFCCDYILVSRDQMLKNNPQCSPRKPVTQVMEHGRIFFAYRPKIDVDCADVHGLTDIAKYPILFSLHYFLLLSAFSIFHYLFSLHKSPGFMLFWRRTIKNTVERLLLATKDCRIPPRMHDIGVSLTLWEVLISDDCIGK
jgi:hypothetical protein